MNFRAVVPVLALLVSAAAEAAVDPNLLALAMPDAKVLYGVQVRETLASPFGQFALAHLPQSDGVAKFAAATGFDLQRDLREVLIASPTAGAPGDNPAVLVLATGTFAPDKFLGLAITLRATVSDYRGIQVITPPQPQDTRVFAFLDNSTIAMGSEPVIRAVID